MPSHCDVPTLKVEEFAADPVFDDDFAQDLARLEVAVALPAFRLGDTYRLFYCGKGGGKGGGKPNGLTTEGGTLVMLAADSNPVMSANSSPSHPRST